MVFTNLISLIWIMISSIFWGAGASKAYKRVFEKKERDTEQASPVRQFCLVTVIGSCVLTVYAEYYSLFDGVNATASMIVLGGNCFFGWWCRHEIGCFLNRMRKQPIKVFLAIIMALALGALVGLPALTYPIHYDTYLYHAQAIRWIEEYGVVPGLGNLHNRLAYNSAFMCLQALFSLKWLTGVSQHTVNGFWMWLMSFYAIGGMKVWQGKKIYVSDAFRILVLLFLFSYINVITVSSPNTDQYALGLMLFILAEWIGLMEEEKAEPEEYALLCILSVFAVTVKLSVATLPLLILLPLGTLIKRRAWKKIGGYVAVCLAVVLPFLLRNVMISGYLLYPYPEIDLFLVDWKMPAFTALFDRYEIRVWGQGVRDITKWNAPFGEWFPTWFSSIGKGNVGLLTANPLCILIVFALSIYACYKKDGKWLHLTIVIIAGLMLWMVGSPDIRYGGCYLGMMPMLCAGMILSKVQRKIPERIAGSIAIGLILCLIVFSLKSVCGYDRFIGFSQVRGAHAYQDRACLETELNGLPVYYPEDGDQTGYDPFPSLPYAERLELIEMRGDTYRQGFRMKEEYRDQNVTTYGTIHEGELF